MYANLQVSGLGVGSGNLAASKVTINRDVDGNVTLAIDVDGPGEGHNPIGTLTVALDDIEFVDPSITIRANF